MTAPYGSRVERLRELAGEQGFDVLLLSDPADFGYLAGVLGLSRVRPLWLVVPASGPCSLVVPRIEAPVARRASWIEDQREWVEWPAPGVPDDWAVPLLDVLGERGCLGGTIGVELGSLTAADHRRLGELLPSVTLVDCGALVAELRCRKDPTELDLMRRAGRVVMAALDAVCGRLAPGVAEYELALVARAAGTGVAADLLGDDHLVSPLLAGVQMIVAAGPERSAMAHARASTYRVRRDDLVQICLCGPAFAGYQVGFDRPLVPDGAELSRERTTLLDVALGAHDAALAAIRPGVVAGAVHSTAVSVVAAAGMLDHLAHRTGHGLGAGGAEPPELRESDKTVLEAGMTFTVEPGIYVPGVGGARFGDTVVVTETGFEVLTPALYGWRDR